MVNEVNLHIGCGENYFPKSLNIDINEKSIADMVAHAIFLPIKDDSVASIKSYHLIEHFDWVDIQYLFNEWYRVLKGGGKVIIEVPDIEKGIKDLKQNKILKNQVKCIQWMFGIDSLGMHHKAGLTFDVIRNILQELGFEDIIKEKPKTHLYGKGLRICCIKPEEEILDQKIIHRYYKTRIFRFMLFNPSKEKTLLELNHLNKIYELLRSLDKIKAENQLIEAILDLSIANPTLGLELLDVLTNRDMISPENIKKCENLLIYLEKISFQKKIINLWKKKGKQPGKFNEEFQRFIQKIKNKLIINLRNNNNIEKNFSYISKLENSNLLFFDKYFILQSAVVNFNLGLRYFTKKDYTLALIKLRESLRYSKDSFLVYWNIARLLAIKDDPQVEKFYKTAYHLIQDKGRKILLLNEMKEVLIEKNVLKYRDPYMITD
ncbi:class I SAM-dependent methyltransferase [Candidatus Hodarchaeum mangrovi]